MRRDSTHKNHGDKIERYCDDKSPYRQGKEPLDQITKERQEYDCGGKICEKFQVLIPSLLF